VDVTEAVFARVGGVPAAFASRKEVFVEGEKVNWIEIGITKKEFQGMGLQESIFFRFVWQSYLGAIKDYIARKEGNKFFNYIRVAPSLFLAMFYIVGITSSKPEEMASVASTLAFLAVQPVSLSPFKQHVRSEKLFPNVNNLDQEPSDRQLAIARAVKPHEARLDEKTLVISGDYGGIEHLIVDKKGCNGRQKVLNSGDSEVDTYMEKRLKYDGVAGLDQMVIVDFDLEFFRDYFGFIVQRWRGNSI